MLYRPLDFYRKTCVFPPVGLGTPFKPLLAYVITSVRPTNTSNLIEIGSQGAPPRSGELSRFCDFCSPFFHTFFHLAYRSQIWTDSNVLWLKRCFLFCTRAFPGVRAFKITSRGSPIKKHQNFDPFLDLTDLQRMSQ